MNGHCKHFIISAEELRISTQTLSNKSDYNGYKQLKITSFLLDDHILPVMKQLGITDSEETHSAYCSSTDSICDSIYKLIYI